MSTDAERRLQIELGATQAALAWTQQELLRERTRSAALDMRLSLATMERDHAAKVAAELLKERGMMIVNFGGAGGGGGAASNEGGAA